MDIILFRLSDRFRRGFEPRVVGLGDVRVHHIDDVSSELVERANVLITNTWPGIHTKWHALQLVQVPGAGADKLDVAQVPLGVPIANCYGHEYSIAEYVIASALRHAVPLTAADAALRENDWRYGAGSDAMRGTLRGMIMGVLGFGHVGKAVANLASACGMKVVVANRTPEPVRQVGYQQVPLDQVDQLYKQADYVVCTLPLAPNTKGFINSASFQAMKPCAVLINVGRGDVIDQRALFAALSERQIAFAVIDTWFNYPASPGAHAKPSSLDFADLPNILMTPHMAAWTDDTIDRRQAEIAENIRRLLAGEDLLNLIARDQLN